MKRSTKRNLFFIFIAAIGYGVFQFNNKLKKLKDIYNECLIFNGKQVCFEEGQEFSDDSIAAVFSGIDMDLTKASLVGDIVTLDLYGMFSGIRIKVPEGWNVKVEGIDDKSGISNKVEYDEENHDLPLLHINYELKYSGLEITH